MWPRKKSYSWEIVSLKSDIEMLTRRLEMYREEILDALERIEANRTSKSLKKYDVTLNTHMIDGSVIISEAGAKTEQEILDFKHHMANQMQRSEVIMLGSHIAFARDINHLEFIKDEVSKGCCQCCCSTTTEEN